MATELWAVATDGIFGSGIYPMPDLGAAQQAADRINNDVAQREAAGRPVVIWNARPARWTRSPEEHADGVRNYSTTGEVIGSALAGGEA